MLEHTLPSFFFLSLWSAWLDEHSGPLVQWVSLCSSLQLRKADTLVVQFRHKTRVNIRSELRDWKDVDAILPRRLISISCFSSKCSKTYAYVQVSSSRSNDDTCKGGSKVILRSIKVRIERRGVDISVNKHWNVTRKTGFPFLTDNQLFESMIPTTCLFLFCVLSILQ